MRAERSPAAPAGTTAAATWFVLLVLGQGAALALTEAGPVVAYQHLRFPSRPLSWIASAVLCLQALFVATALRPRWGQLLLWVRSRASGRVILFALVALVVSSATVSRDPLVWLLELATASLIQLVALGNVILIGLAIPPALAERGLAVVLGPESRRHDPGIDAFPLALAGLVLVACSLLALLSYQRHPHVPDEVAYLLHAKYLARGHVELPLPAAARAFDVDLMHFGERTWFSPVPPGWPVVLALGVKAGAPWLVNPVLAAVNVLLGYALMARVYDRPLARVGTLLTVCSPWFVFMGMNFMTHHLTLSLALVAGLCVARWRRVRDAGGRLRGLSSGVLALGGAAIGATSLIRPLDGLITALVVGCWSLPTRWWSRWREPSAFLPSAVLAVTSAVVGLLVRPYNRMLTGDPSYFPIMAYADRYYGKGTNDLGFGSDRGLAWSGLDPFPGHGLRDVIVNSNLNITTANIELLGWASGSLVAIAVLFVIGRRRPADTGNAAVVGLVAALHAFYWFSGGPDFGPRYWFLMIASCVMLAARGIVTLADATGRTAERGRVVLAAGALCASTTLTFMPWRAIDKYHHYRGMRPDVRALDARMGFGRSLVFIRGKRHPDYASAAVYNPVDFGERAPLYVWDASLEIRREALEAYSDRPVWFIDGTTRTGGDYAVVGGPMSARQALQFPPP